MVWMRLLRIHQQGHGNVLNPTGGFSGEGLGPLPALAVPPPDRSTQRWAGRCLTWPSVEHTCTVFLPVFLFPPFLCLSYVVCLCVAVCLCCLALLGVWWVCPFVLFGGLLFGVCLVLLVCRCPFVSLRCMFNSRVIQPSSVNVPCARAQRKGKQVGRRHAKLARLAMATWIRQITGGPVRIFEALKSVAL